LRLLASRRLPKKDTFLQTRGLLDFICSNLVMSSFLTRPNGATRQRKSN
jgi:hypothetical protein